jgi:general secretion pathway protein G
MPTGRLFPAATPSARHIRTTIKPQVRVYTADMKRSFIPARAFTLIELLVVMAIIGILSAVVLTSLNSARQRGRDARRISDIKQIQLALDLYYDSRSYYPPVICPGGAAPCASSELVTNGYIASLPLDPSTNAPYIYVPYGATTNPGVCVSYHLGADLESGSSHTSLQTDADVIAFPSGLQLCTNAGVTATQDFSGSDAGKCVPPANSNPGTACYDVRS